MTPAHPKKTKDDSRPGAPKKAGKHKAAAATSPEGVTASTGAATGPKPGKPARARSRVGEKRARLNESLILELRALRTAVTQATEAFDLRVGGRIAEMLQTLEGDDSLEQKPSHLTVVDAEAALAVFAADKPSPGKGRVRELRRLQRLVRRLRRAMPG